MFKKKLLNKAVLATVLGGMMLAPSFALGADVNITAPRSAADPNVVNYQVTLSGTYAVNTANSDVLTSVSATNPYVELRIKSDKTTTYLPSLTRANLTKAITNVLNSYGAVSKDVTNVKVVLYDADGLPYATGQVSNESDQLKVNSLDFVFTRPMNPTTAGTTYKYYPSQFSTSYIAATDTKKIEIDLSKMEGDVKAALLLPADATAAWSRTMNGVSVIADGTKLDAGVVPYGIHNASAKTLTISQGVELQVKGTNPVGVYAGNTAANTANTIVFSGGTTTKINAEGGTAFLAEKEGKIGIVTSTYAPTAFEEIVGDIKAKDEGSITLIDIKTLQGNVSAEGKGSITLTGINALQGNVSAEGTGAVSLRLNEDYAGTTSVADTANLTLKLGFGKQWTVNEDSALTDLDGGLVSVAAGKTLTINNLKGEVSSNYTATGDTVNGGNIALKNGEGTVKLTLTNLGTYTSANITDGLRAMAEKVSKTGEGTTKVQAWAVTKAYTDTALGELYIADFTLTDNLNLVTAEKYLYDNRQIFGSATKDKLYAANITKDEKGNLVYTFNDNLCIERSSSLPVDGMAQNTTIFWSSIFGAYGDADPFTVANNPTTAGVLNYTVDMKNHKLTASNTYLSGRQKDMDRSSIINMDREGTITFKNVGGMDLFASADYYYTSAIRAGAYGYTESGAHIVIENGEGWDNAVKATSYLTDPTTKTGFAMDNYIIFVEARNATLKAPADLDEKTLSDTNTIDIKGLVDIEAMYGQFGVTAWGEKGRIDIGGGKIDTRALTSEYTGTGMPAISTTGNSVVNFNVTKGEDGKANGAGNNPVMIDGMLQTSTQFYGSGGSINLGLNTSDSYLKGDVIVDGSSIGDPSYQAMGEGEAKIWMGNGAQWTGSAKASELGMLQINMTGEGTKWTGTVTGDATPALTLKDGAVFEPQAPKTVLGILNIDGGQLSLKAKNFTVSSQQGTVKYATDMVISSGKTKGTLVIDNLTTLTGDLGTFFSNTNTKGVTAGELVYSKDDSIQLVGGYLRLKTDEYSLSYADSANELIHSLVYNKKNSNTIVLFDGKLVLDAGDFGMEKMAVAAEDTYQDVVGISDVNLTFGKTGDTDKGEISHGINIAALRLINADTVTVENGAKLTLGSANAENLISSIKPVVTVNVKGENSKFVLGRKADQTYKLTGGINVEDNASLEINGNYFAKGDIKIKNATLVIDDGAGVTISEKARKTVSGGNVLTSEGYAITLDNANLTVGKNVTMSADMIISGTSSMSGVASTTMLFGDSDAVLKIGSDKYGRLMIEDSMVIEPVKPYPAATTYNESKTGSYNGTVFVSAPAGASIDEVSVANYKTNFNNTYIKHKIIGGQNSIISVGGASVTDAIDMFKSTGLTWGEDVKAALYFKGNSPANTASNFGIYIDGTWTDVPEASNLGKSTSGGVIQISGDSILMVDGAATGAMSASKTSGLFTTYGTDAKTNTLKIADGAKLYIKDAVAGTKYNLLRNGNIGSVDSPNWAVGNPWFTDLNSTETAKNIFTTNDLIRFVRTLGAISGQEKFQYTLQAVEIGTTNLTVSDGDISAFTNAENVTTTVNADLLKGAVTNQGTMAFTGGTLKQAVNGGAVTIADEKKLTVGDGGSISASITGNALDLGNHEWTVTGQSKLKKLTAGSTGAESIIFMNADKSLVIDEYSGNSKVFYTHINDGDEASDYAASAVKIKSAAADSVITLITDNNGIDTTNSELTDKVLNRLANKLFYYNAGNDSNLSGKVAIAEGLTAASAYKMIGDVVYNTTTGQGGYGAAPEDIVYNVSITGDSAVDTGYDADGVLENGKYTFEMPTAIEIADIADAGAVMATKSLTIDTNDLAINLVGHGSSNSYGIKAVGNDAANTLKVTVDGGETKIIAKDGTKSNIGIYASGNSLVTVNGDLIMHAGEGYAVNTAKSGWDYYGATAIYAANNYGDMQKGGQITVNGQVDLLVDANGVFVNGGGGVVTLAGGSIEINKDNTKHYAALRAESGYINMNMNADKTAAGTNKVNILGNVDTTAGAYNLASEPCVDSIVNLGMTTSDSTWTGVAYNAFPDAGLGGIATTGTWKGQERKFIGAINLWLQNGAIWNNEQYGAIEKPYTGSAFTGSHVNNFVGGDSSSNAGVIIHKDTNPLTIDNYSGNVKVVMSHSNDGDEVSDYVAGNLIIKSAAEGSVITLVTDKRGIDVDNAGAVENTLGALASKLFYTASTMGENYLTGYVSIAEGLTAKSVSMFTGGIEFNATTGQGVYKDITPPPPVPVDPDPTSVSDKYLMGTMSDSSFLGGKVASVEGAVTYDLTDETYSFRQMSTVADAKVVLNVGTQNTVYFDGMKNGNLAMMVNDGANVTINGNVNTTSYGSSYSAAGIAMIIGGSGAGKETHLTINGKVTMGSLDAPGVVAKDKHGGFGTYRGTRWTGAAINMNQGHGSTINITDGLTAYADGHGIVTDPYYPDKKYADKDLAVVTVNGPTTIHVGSDEDVGLYALASYGGTININMKDGAPGKDKVTIIGNAIAMKDTLGDEKNPYFYRNGRINLALTTADSVWTGAVDNTGTTQAGEFNLYLQNGGTWNYQNASKMDGLSASTMPTPSNGYYGNYDGVSHVTSLTGGSSNEKRGVIKVNFGDTLSINNYSGNVVAIYKHDAENPTTIYGGDIEIAKAKVASVITLSTDNAGVDDGNFTEVLNALAGKLYYTGGDEALIGKVQIAEGLTWQSVALYTGNIAYDPTTGQGSYTDKESTTVVDTAIGAATVTEGGAFKVAETATEKTLTMDMPKLVSVATGPALQSLDDKPLVIENANATLVLQSKDADKPVVAADKGDVKIAGALEVVGQPGQKLIDVGAGKMVKIGGGALTAVADPEKPDDAPMIMTLAQDTVVSIGVPDSGAAPAEPGAPAPKPLPVKLTGDIKNTAGILHVNLATADSFWKGNYRNEDAVLHLTIDNKDAKWEGTVNGAELNVNLNAGTWVNTGESKSNSDKFTLNAGGAKKAFIDMRKDSGAITIDKYSGGMTLMYSNKEDMPTTINGGDIIIRSAAAGSVVNLWTDGKGLDLKTEVGINADNDNAVKDVLNALAKKLTYVNYADGNITGEVGVGEGLVRPALTFPKAAELVFKTADGKGSIDADTFKDNIPHGEVVYGDSETAMMRGAKMAMASTAMIWRAEGNDLTKRMGDLQLRKEEAGIWAKYYSGRQEYNNNGSFSNKYKAVQVGVDKELGHGWLGGVALSYDDGKGSLNNGGRADNKVQSLGFYGTKVNKNGEYIDLIGKFSRLENEYTVYNDYGYSLDGDYKNFGMNVSAEYGKHINLKNGFVLTPAAEFTLGRVNSKNYSAYSEYYKKSMKVEQDAFNSAIGRIGISLGKETDRYSYYAKLGLAHEFAGGFDTTYSAPGEPTSSTSVDFKDTWKEVQVGGSVKLKNDALLYGSFSKSFGGDVKEKWRVDAGLMFTFNHLSDFFLGSKSNIAVPAEEVQTGAVAAVQPAPVVETGVVGGSPVEATSVTVGDEVAVATPKQVKNADNTYVMDEFVVTASRVKQRITDATADVSVVTRAEIEAMHMNTVEEVLRTVPGVEFNNYGSGNQMNANMSSVRINGSKDVAVLVDGVKINDFQGVDESGNMYAGVLNNMNNIERVEVLRGAAGVLYGSGAKGGVINIITREIAENSTTVDASVGSFGRKDTKFNTMGKAGKLTYNFSQGTYKQGDVTDGRGEKWEGHTKTNNFGGKVTYAFTDNNKLTLDYMDVHSNFGGTDFVYKNYYSGKYDSTMWSIRDDWQIDKNWNNTFVYRQNEEKRLYKQDGFDGRKETHCDTDSKYTFISDQITFHNDRHNLVMGVDYSVGKSQPTPSVEVEREMKNTSFYINEDWTIVPHVTLSGGIRHDRPSEDKYGSKIDNSHTSKSYKLAWDVTKKDTVYTGRSEYFILPSMSQLYDKDWGNEDLKPAEGRTESIGYNRKFDDNNFFTVNYYQTKEECGIGWDGYNRVNTSGVSRGWNAQYTSRLSDKWNFNVGWSHLFEHSDGDDTYTLGYYPRDLATFGVYYNVGKFDAGFDGYWFFRKMDYSGRREFPADNYGIYNLSLNYKPTKNMKLYCKVENIFDKYYAEHTDAGDDIYLGNKGDRKYYAMPGRAIMVGLQFTF